MEDRDRAEERPASRPGRRLTWTLRGVLGGVLALSSAGLLFGVSQAVRQAEELAERSLEATGIALAAAAEQALRSAGEQRARAVLSDRVVAYGLIASADGRVLLHTNPDLAGSVLPQPEVAGWLAPGRPWGRRVQLGTGTPAYEFFYAVHRLDGGVEVLRLVLHAAGAEGIEARARRLWWGAGALIGLLWAAGLALERAAARQVRLQEALDRRERLALVGQMTATLAHEIRNALGGIKGFAQWLDERMPADDSRKVGVCAVLRGSARVEELVDGLLDYAREESYRSDAVDLDEAVREAAAAALEGWAGKVTLGVSGLTVLADRPKLVAALVNGLRNAREAAGDGGAVGVTAAASGSRVEVSIEDSGAGIPPEDEARLFTPFFTTKASGTGLGLAYSKKVLEGMGGTIRLASRKTGGAALTLSLRRA